MRKSFERKYFAKMSSHDGYDEFFGIDTPTPKATMPERTQAPSATTSEYCSTTDSNRRSVRQLEFDVQVKEMTKASQSKAQTRVQPGGTQTYAKMQTSRDSKDLDDFALKARERAGRLTAPSQHNVPINGNKLENNDEKVLHDRGSHTSDQDISSSVCQNGAVLTSFRQLDNRMTAKVAEQIDSLTLDAFRGPVAARERHDEEISTNSNVPLDDEASMHKTQNSGSFHQPNHSVFKAFDFLNDVRDTRCTEGTSTTIKMATNMSDPSSEETVFTTSRHFPEIKIDECIAGKPATPSNIDTVDKATKGGLAVAFAVSEEKNDPHIAAAIEYDPNAKPSSYEHRRFRMYWLIACLVFVIGFAVILFSVGIGKERRSTNASSLQPQIPYRETLGIRATIARIVSIEKLDVRDDPFSRALQWITHDDPMQLLPTQPNFVQRYLLACMYYSSIKVRPWTHCNPPTLGTNETIDCIYEKLVPGVYDREKAVHSKILWKRWLSNVTECGWTGITCNDNDAVNALELPGIGMSGPMPEALLYLADLESISFHGNALTGTLPTALAKLTNMKNIELQDNLFTGTIPDSWFTSMPLERISISFNALDGSIPSSIGSAKTLKGVFFEFNMLSGTIPNEIIEIKRLQNLRLTANLLEGPLPSFGSNGVQSNIREIMMNRNYLTGTLPSSIFALTSLVKLEFRNNLLSGTLPETIYNSSNLNYLDVSQNAMTGTISTNVGSMSNLESLKLEFNIFSGSLPTQLGLIANLNHLFVTYNDFTGAVPTNLCGISTLEADCYPTNTSWMGSLLCPDNCCTRCCSKVSDTCMTMLDN